MRALYILALLVHTAYSCTDGIEIVSKELENYNDAIGNWTFLYHWNKQNNFPIEVIDGEKEYFEYCPTMEITAASEELILEKKKQCSGKKYPFDWKNAKLKLDAPALKDNLIVLGERENWLVIDCSMYPVVMKHVADDYLVMTNSDAGDVAELMSKHIPKRKELKCVAQNVDIGKGMNGVGLCA